jgi:hypothetical protein
VGKETEKEEEAEGSKTWRRRESASMAISGWEPVDG